jgi:hypothetical protein
MWARRTVLGGVVAAAVVLAVPELSAVEPVARAATPSATVQAACDAPLPGHLACLALRRVAPQEPTALSTRAVDPATPPRGYGPADLRSAYSLPAGSAGAGRTVAVVDAYDDPHAAADLATYRAEFGLPACTVANGCFTKVSQTGSTTVLPAADEAWAQEISLDLDMVSAACPNCHILLVEARDTLTGDLLAGVDEAVQLGATAVSNSYGGPDGDDSAYDADLDRPGVAITVAAGDDGYGMEYPASSPYVTAVGGTSLVASASARGWTESAWGTSASGSGSGTGSGCSPDESKPAFQGSITACSTRAVSDVSAVADPDTGVAVYDSTRSGWGIYGGTSAAAPIIAAVYALAGTPSSSVPANSYPYADTAALNDVTSGVDGSCSPAVLCTAGPGWDGPTGLGTPNGVGAFTVPTTPASGALTVADPGAQTAVAGTRTALALHASGGAAPDVWTASGLPGGLTIGRTTGLISGTPTRSGTATATITVTDAYAATARVGLSWTVRPGSLARMVQSGSSAAIAGAARNAVVLGYDSVGDPLGDVTAASTFRIAPVRGDTGAAAGASCRGSSCTATRTGRYTVTATDRGITASASLTITSGRPSRVVLSGGAGQSAATGSAYRRLPAVTVVDAYGNPVVGAVVTFTVAVGPAHFAHGAATVRIRTGTGGRAVAHGLTAGRRPGSVVVVVSVRGARSALRFRERVTARG